MAEKFYICLKGELVVLIPSSEIKDSKALMQQVVDDLVALDAIAGEDEEEN